MSLVANADSLTLIPATGGVGEMTPSAVFVENRIMSNGMRQLFCDIVTDPLGFPSSYIYHYVYFRFYMVGSDVTST